MQYMLLIYEPAGAYDGPSGETLIAEVVAKHMALASELRGKGIQKDGAGLQGVETARTVATTGGKTSIHDGPYAEAREELGGYYLIDVASMDEALTIAARIPVADGGKVEVRPLIMH